MAWANGYNYRRTITIDHTKCGSADSSDWVFYFPGHADLAHTDHSGKTTNESGYDIIFTSDASGSTVLDFERVSHNHETGLGEWHVQIPTLDADTDTVIHLFYGNASVTTDQSDKTGTWDSNFRAVYHFGDGSTLSGSDSTSNGETLTNYSATADAGKVGGAVRVTSTPHYMSQPDNTAGDDSPADNFLLSAWIKINSVITLWSQDVYIGWGTGNAGPKLFIGGGRHPRFWNGNETSGTIALNTWTHLAVRGSSGTYTYYLNGSAEGTTITTAPADYGYGHFFVANDFNDPGNKADGWVDEARFCNAARTPSWILADYNNQSSPSTFYTIGAAEFGSSIKTINNLSRSSIATRNNLSISNMKTLNGTS